MKLFTLLCGAALLIFIEAQRDLGESIPPPPVEGAEVEINPGTYIAIVPETIRPNRPYSATVTLMKDFPGNQVEMKVTSSDNKTEVASVTKSNLRKETPVTIRIDEIPASKLLDGLNYKVTVKGTAGGKTLFEESSDVYRDGKSLSIFVQTDKAVYKPGSIVRYRVVVVDPNLKPYSRTVNIRIKDTNDNIITQYNNKALDRGVYSNEIKLSEEPPLGQWSINVKTADGNEYTKNFDVDKYVLPKFEVTVEREDGANMVATDDLVVKVKATYTYGKGVEGEGSVQAKYPWNWSERRPILKKIKLDKSGEAMVRFSNAELKRAELIGKWGHDQIDIVASITEGLTGKERNGTMQVQTRKENREISIESNGQNFKPGLPLEFLVVLKDINGKPVSSKVSKKVQLEVEYVPKWNSSPFEIPVPSVVRLDEGVVEELPASRLNEFPTPPPPTKKTSLITLNADGTTTVTLEDIPSNTQNLNVVVRHTLSGKNFDAGRNENSDFVESRSYFNPTKSPSDNFIQIKARNPGSIRAGQEVVFDVEATNDIQELTYQVVTRGFIALSEDKRMRGSKGEIRFLATPDMAPSAKLIAYYVRPENNEIIVDASEFKVDGLFTNKVSVEAKKDEFEPGNTCRIQVTADPGSFIGLLGVDQSVLLLKSGNDIDSDMVENEIESYGRSSGGGCGPWGCPFFGRGKRSIWFPWGISGQDAKSVFNKAGLKVITDALLYSAQPDWSRGGPPVAFAGPVARPAAAGAPGPAGAARRIKGGQPPPSPPKAAASAPKTRSKFPETWIWADESSSNFSSSRGSRGSMVYSAAVPDTITSWIVSGFAVNDRTGLGVAPDTAKITVFRPFFISLNLPYSVKRGEKVALQVNVFNYQEGEKEVDVNLKHDDKSGFDFVAPNGRVQKPGTGVSNTYNIRRVKVPGGGGSKAVFFPIIPTKIGDVILTVTATAGNAGDKVERPLLVEPEGFRVEQNEPVMIDLSRTTSFKKTISPDFPRNAVRDSEFAEVSVVGDIMGPVLQNIERLVRMPYGCGEQNMVNFVPNIVVMKYLKATDRLSDEIEGKAKKFMESGYQRELNYKRKDHSFSAFGDSDDQGSTFLTAFVVKSFKQAQKYIYVDDKILDDSIGFLLEKQTPDGDFQEDGEVHHKGLLGGNSKSGKLPMTAYILSTLIINGKENPRALKYLEDNLRDANTPYAAALVTYALHLANSDKKDDAFRMMEDLKITGDGLAHWEAVRELRDDVPKYWREPAPADVEINSYALLTYVLRNMIPDALPIVRWLASKRNSLGGYSSTQDTIMALQALGAYAEKAYSDRFNVQLKVRSGIQQQSFSVDKRNSLVLQSAKVENPTDDVEITASGSGIVYAQLSWRYNLNKQKDNPAFDCRAKTKENGINSIDVEMCCKYKKGKSSNMAVVGVDALSGFEFNEEELQQLTNQPKLQRAELTKGNTHADIYFESIGRSNRCFNLKSERAYKVAEQKPAVFQAYDYYKPAERVDFEYSPRSQPSFRVSCPECWQNMLDSSESSPGTGSQGCNDGYSKCNAFCYPMRQDRLYLDWFEQNREWLFERCRKSCELC